MPWGWYGRGAWGWGRGWGGWGGGWGNPYPFCRAFPWLPRGWWKYGYAGYPGWGSWWPRWYGPYAYPWTW